MNRKVLAVPASFALTLALAGCSSTAAANTHATAAANASAAAPRVTATVDVYAAASLTDVFTQIADDYMAEHPGIQIRLTFAGSSDLATQINEGAPADVFASANEKQMAVAGEHIDGKAELFASNTLTIAVPAGNPGGVTDFASLAKPGLRVVVCAPEVPCGAATVTVEKALGVTISPVSELTNVTDVLGSVASGEADAGLVYVTDLARAKGVEGIPFAGSNAAVSRYPIAVLTLSHSPTEARGFMDFVMGPKGRTALAAAGFAAPDARAAG
jgi:molybdate transport system substrate-binding protein